MMVRGKIRSFFYLCTIIIGVWLSPVIPIESATAQTIQQTNLEILVDDYAPLDAISPIIVRLTSGNGMPIAGQVIHINLAGIYQTRVRTDSLGQAHFVIPSLPSAGIYQISAEYLGSPDYQPAQTKKRMLVGPAEIVIHTVPSLSGVEFSLDGRKFQSGPDGSARITVNRAGTYPIELLTSEIQAPTFRAVFQRWEPESFNSVRRARVPESSLLQVGFEVSRLVDLAFVNLEGDQVEDDLISSILIRSSNGAVFSIQDFQENWFSATMIQRRLTGLDSVTISHSVQQVEVIGSNVVNRGQQRFSVEGQQQVQIELLLYTLHFVGKDSLFGFPMGSGVELEYPDGSIRFHPFQSENTLSIKNLPRGSYRARLMDAHGFAFSIPIAVSRDQAIVLPVISYLNIGLFSVVILIILVSPLLMGRRISQKRQSDFPKLHPGDRRLDTDPQ